MNMVLAFSHAQPPSMNWSIFKSDYIRQEERTLKKTKTLKRTNKSECVNSLPSKLVFVCYGFEVLETHLIILCFVHGHV